MDFVSVDAYLNKLHGADLYTQLAQEKKEPLVFTATELLTDAFGVDKLTERIVSLQVLYMLEGEQQGYAMLKRQGITQYANKGVSATFNGSTSDIAPSVLGLIQTSGARVGRLI